MAQFFRKSDRPPTHAIEGATESTPATEVDADAIVKTHLPEKRERDAALNYNSPSTANSTPKSKSELSVVAEDPAADDSISDHATELESVTRLTQKIIAPLKIERHVVFHEKPSEENSPKATPGESSDWGLASEPAPRGFGWIIIGVIALIVLGFALRPLINRTDTSEAIADETPIETAVDSGEKDAAAVNFFVNRQDDAERIFKIFSTTRLWQDLQPWIRETPKTAQLVASTWQPLGFPVGWKSSSKLEWSVIQAGPDIWAALQGTLPDHRGFYAYFVEQDGRLMLDWKATSCYSSATFSQLVKGSGDSSEIRGYLTLTDFYTTAWPENDYQSFQLLDPNKEISIWCFIRRSSDDFKTVMQWLQNQQADSDASGDQKITLQLERGPEDSAANQWRISRLLNLDWIAPQGGKKP